MKDKYFNLNLSLEHKEGLTEDQVSDFLSEVIAVAEKYNFTCGGGIKAVDKNGNPKTGFKPMELKLAEHQEALLLDMSEETIKYFAALMHAFNIPNYVETKAICEGHEYLFRIDKKEIDL